MRVTSVTGDEVAIRLTPAQNDLIGECLLLAAELSCPADISLYIGASPEEIKEVRSRLGGAQDRTTESVFSIRQLHIVYATLGHALIALPSGEEFHIRIGFYRENAQGLALALGYAFRESRSST